MPALPLPLLLRLLLREIESPAVEVLPLLTPERLEGARAFADYGDEQPLLLLDDTRDGTGREGVLMTAAAFYFSKPPVRVPLATIREVPEYPDGPRRAGLVPAAGGPIALPLLKANAARDALHRALNAASATNGGRTDVAMPSVPSSATPIGELVRKHLLHRDVMLAPELSAVVLRSMVLATGPLDATSGEQIFAAIDESGGKGAEGIVVTDRRLVYRRGDERLSIPYDTVEEAQVQLTSAEGWLEVLTGAGQVTLRLVRRRKALAALSGFLNDMVRNVAPVWRNAPITVQRGPSDPAGLASALRLLAGQDPRPSALCKLIADAQWGGAMPADVAWDFVHRALLLDHGLTIGRSMNEGWWVSPLEAPDLLFLLRRLLGRPFQEGPAGEGHALAFVFDAQRAEQWMRVITGTPVAQAVTGVYGAGALRARTPAITALRVEVHPLGARGLFGVTATTEGRRAALDDVAGGLFAGFDHALAVSEARLLLIRVLLGGVFRATELWETPPDKLRERVEKLGGDPSIVEAFAVS